MNANIRINEDIFDCFAPEIAKRERSDFKINKIKEGLEFEVTAKDAVALRSTLNSIAKLLIVHEKIKNLVQNA